MIVAILVVVAGWFRKPAAAVSIGCIGLVFQFAKVGWHLVVMMPASQILLIIGIFIASVVPAYFVGAGLRWAWIRYCSRSNSEAASLATQFANRRTATSLEEEVAATPTGNVPAKDGAGEKADLSLGTDVESPTSGGGITPQPDIVRQSVGMNWGHGLFRLGVVASTVWIGVVFWVFYRWKNWEAEVVATDYHMLKKCISARQANPSLGDVFDCPLFDSGSFDDAVYDAFFPFQSFILKNIEIALLPAGFLIAAAMVWTIQGFGVPDSRR
jgi:hypothetical protein